MTTEPQSNTCFEDDESTGCFSFTLLPNHSNPRYIAEGSYGAVWKVWQSNNSSNSNTNAPNDDPNRADSAVSGGGDHASAAAPEGGDGEWVAIKVIRDVPCSQRMCTEAQKHEYVKRLYREVAVMSLFEKCDCFVHIKLMYRSRDGRDDLYIVMPFVDHSLATVLSDANVRGKGIEESLLCYILMQMLVALLQMERCRCIHRDITPSNILIGGDCFDVYLADFGLSRAHFAPGYDMTNRDLVTLPYRPPEILLRGKNLDNAIDMWSLGVVAVELLLGAPFVHGRDDLGQLKLILQYVSRPQDLETTRDYVSDPAFAYLSREWGFVSQCNPDVGTVLQQHHKELGKPPLSDGCVDVLRRMLQFSPRERPKAAELLQHEWFRNSADADTLAALLVRVEVNMPPCGLPPDIESETTEGMLAKLLQLCSATDELVAQGSVEILSYQGKHVDR